MRDKIRATMTALVTAAVLVTAACSDDDDPTWTGPDISGTYLLVSFNGTTPPGVVSEDASLREEILGGELTLTATHWTIIIVWRDTDLETGEMEEETVSDTATYHGSGNQVVFFRSDGLSVTGEVSGDTITVTIAETGEDDFVYVFER